MKQFDIQKCRNLKTFEWFYKVSTPASFIKVHIYFKIVEGGWALGNCGSGVFLGVERAKVRPIEKMIRNWAVGITLSRRSRVRGWL